MFQQRIVIISINDVLYDRAINTIITYPAAKTNDKFIIPGSITTIGNAAFMGSYLGQVTIPDSVTSIGSEAFSSCSLMTEVNIGSGIESIEDNTFNGCSSLEVIDIPHNVRKDWRQCFFGLYVIN